MPLPGTHTEKELGSRCRHLPANCHDLFINFSCGHASCAACYEKEMSEDRCSGTCGAPVVSAVWVKGSDLISPKLCVPNLALWRVVTSLRLPLDAGDRSDLPESSEQPDAPLQGGKCCAGWASSTTTVWRSSGSLTLTAWT